MLISSMQESLEGQGTDDSEGVVSIIKAFANVESGSSLLTFDQIHLRLRFL